MYIFLAIAAALIVVALILKRGGPGGAGRANGREGELYQRLLAKAFGDRAQAERLIEVERQKNPGAGRAAWIKDAIERWERHNR